MNIAVDVMSGENHPSILIKGAIDAIINSNVSLVFVGDEKVISKELDKYSTNITNRISIEHAPEVIGMNESPAKACRKKKKSSIMVATQLIADKKADGMFSPGNTGATMTASLFNIKRIKGVVRPAIAVILPTLKGSTLLLDGGASVDCSPQSLVQFAVMGEIFMKYIVDIKYPTISLLSIGEEDHKGNDASQKAFKIMKSVNFNFVGNIEGHNVFEGDVDVIVCDGFIGNIVIKLSEGLGSVLMRLIKNEIMESFSYRLGAFMAKGAFRNVKNRLHPATYGGAPLLGVNGCVIIGHGSTGELATKNGVLTTIKLAKTKINNLIADRIKSYIEI